jgi:DHA1 family tetracycline resistance protein-like MFS transporter
MSFLQPGLQGLMTRRVGPQNQGQLQGANQSLQGIASVVGPIIFGLTFAWAVRQDAVLHAPGLPIFIAAGLLVCAFLLAVRVGHAPAGVATAAAE